MFNKKGRKNNSVIKSTAFICLIYQLTGISTGQEKQPVQDWAQNLAVLSRHLIFSIALSCASVIFAHRQHPRGSRWAQKLFAIVRNTEGLKKTNPNHLWPSNPLQLSELIRENWPFKCGSMGSTGSRRLGVWSWTGLDCQMPRTAQTGSSSTINIRRKVFFA